MCARVLTKLSRISCFFGVFFERRQVFVTKKRRRTYTMTERKSSRKTLTPKRFIPEETEKKDKDASGGQKSGGSKARLISSRSLRGCFFFARVKFETFALARRGRRFRKNSLRLALSRALAFLSARSSEAQLLREALSFSFDAHLTLTFFACTFLAHQCKTEIGKQQHDGND